MSENEVKKCSRSCATPCKVCQHNAENSSEQTIPLELSEVKGVKTWADAQRQDPGAVFL